MKPKKYNYKSLFFYGILVCFIVVSTIYLIQMTTYLVKVSQYQMPAPQEAANFKRY